MTKPVKPCVTCPYRRNRAIIGHWAESEYRMLLESSAMDPERSMFVFHCHKHGHTDGHPQQLCTGWLLDQRRRTQEGIKMPTGLVIRLLSDPIAAAQYEAASGDDCDLFESTEQLCEINITALTGGPP